MVIISTLVKQQSASQLLPVPTATHHFSIKRTKIIAVQLKLSIRMGSSFCSPKPMTEHDPFG
jgi:hypothetical protein